MTALWVLPSAIVLLGLWRAWVLTGKLADITRDLAAEHDAWAGFQGDLEALDADVSALGRRLGRFEPEPVNP